jgi:plastocyanin
MRWPMPPVSARSAALVGLALASAAGGCGAGRRSRVTNGRLDLTMREYRLIPQRVDAKAGRLTIVAHDRGVLAHRLAIGRGRFALGQTATVFPGSARTLTVKLSPGRYRLFCSLSNHDTLGMYGSLVVR